MKITRWGLGLLSLAVLLASVSDASAWCGLFSHCGPCHHRHHCFETHITCRPYNAFTPICWGNLTCDGCCPNPCAVASGCMMPGGCGPDACGAGFSGGCAPGGFCGYPGGVLPSYAGGYPGGVLPSYAGVPAPYPGVPMPQPMPTQAPNYNVPPPVNNQTTQYGNPAMYYGVQPASYYPGYYYGYPAAYYPSYPAMPYGYGYGYANPQRPY